MNCYICDTIITIENQTEEHIIINAAGGRLRSRDLICINCNSRFGSSIDAALANQLNGIANMLMIQRQNGVPQPIIATHPGTGDKYKLMVGGTPVLAKPVVKQHNLHGQNGLYIRSSNERDFKHIVKGILKKYPELQEDEILGAARRHDQFIDDGLMVELELGGQDVFRAVCKCAINFFVFNGGDSSSIKHLLPFINGDIDRNDVVWMHYQDVYLLPPRECFHLLHLVASPSEKVIYCYVDYFNTHRFIVLLDDNYSGREICNTYCFDVLNLVSVEKSVNISYDRNTILKLLHEKDTTFFKKVEQAFEHALSIGQMRQLKFQKELLINKAIKQALAQLPKETTLTEQILDQIIDSIAVKLATLITREFPSTNS